MAKYLHYILYGTVCIVTLLVALICMWWFMEKPYTKEDFLVATPFIVMAGLATDGRVYYADVDATLGPKWVYTVIPGLVRDIAGSYGKLYTIIGSGSTVSYGPYDSSSQRAFNSGQNISNLSVDTDGTSIGVKDGTVYTFASPTATPKQMSGTSALRGSASGGTWFEIGGDKNLYYHTDITREGVRVRPKGSADGTWEQVSFDGAVCALQTNGTLWCAGSSITASDSWEIQGTKKFSQISLKGGRLIGVATDNNVYYSNSYVNPSWVLLPRKEYTADGVKKNDTDIAFSKVILMYPSLDARRKRYRGAAAACNPDEQMIGAFCYQPCASDRAPVGASCPYRRLHTPAQPSCAQGYQFIDGSCYAPCPTGLTANGDVCLGATTDKGGANAVPVASVIPAQSPCNPGGTIAARYVRIRPTNLVTLNKLCISSVVVTGASGQVFSLPSRTPSIASSIGRMVGKNIRGALPILAMKAVGNLQIYVTEDIDGGGHVKMIANDAAGTSKYVPFTTGRVTAWKDSFWVNGTAVGTRTTGEYMLILAEKPVTTNATDGTCSDNPIGGRTTVDGSRFCATQFSSFTSGTKNDGEDDGGAKSRMATLYWELDLGGIQQIKTIQILGCGNDPSTKGTRVELLYNSNLPTTTPLVVRTLGPESTTQTLTFNYTTKVPGVDNRCYDDCPPVNGLPTGNGGDMTCVSAPDGITSRSVTTPLTLGDPICTIAKNQDGTPFSIPKQGGAITDWVIDPANPTQALSCDGFGVLAPLNRNFIYPTTTDTLSVDLLKADSTPYTNAVTPYMCVRYDDSACRTGYSFDSPTQMCTSDATDPEYHHARAYCMSNGTKSCPTYNDDTIPYVADNLIYGGHKVNKYTLPQNRNPTHTDWSADAPRTDCGLIRTGVFNDPFCRYDFNVKKVLTKPGQKDLYAIPQVPQANVRPPLVRPADCKCLDGYGNINKTAYIYKNKCVQCSGPKDVFYPTAAKSTTSIWSEEQPNTWMSLYYFVDGYPVAAVDPANHQYYELQDAKAGCEANVRCKGVTRTYDSRGVPYYSLRAEVPRSTADERRGSSGSGIDRTNVTPDDSSWTRREEPTGRKQTLEALHVGFEFFDEDIPRSFADDYVGTFPRAPPLTSVQGGSGASFDLVNIMSAAVLQVQSTWSSFQNSVQRNVYYTQDGVQRHLSRDRVSNEYGICVGPCDRAHEYHDALQMVYSRAATTTTNSPAYILYGTTCHSNTFTRIPRPSIPANYIPQEGAACDPSRTQSGSSCIKQCDADSTDNGTSCTSKPVKRSFVLPSYTCPSKLTLIDNICVHDCGTGFTSDGDYCQPSKSIATLPSTINCTRTDYGYSSGSSSGRLNKWLCDSIDDLTALLADLNTETGVTGVNSYTQPDDIICYPDDPSTAMYYCSSIPDFLNTVEDTQRTDLSTSCDTLTKSYLDLSNNLTVLMNAQTSATSAAGQVRAIQATLQTVITRVCETSSGSSGSATCNTLTRLLGLLQSTGSSGTSPLSAITVPLQVGIQSRDTLIAMLNRYKCCSLEPPGTEYPWCTPR